MDQQRIGRFIKELRKEKGISQEALAEHLNISGRTVSRWETGINLPDISLLVELSAFFDVTITELIDGERNSQHMEKETTATAEAMSSYAAAEKGTLLTRVRIISIAGLLALLMGLIMESISPNSEIPIYEAIKGCGFGIGVGSLATMVLFTTGVLAEIKKKLSKPMKRIAIACIVIVIACLIASLIATLM